MRDETTQAKCIKDMMIIIVIIDCSENENEEIWFFSILKYLISIIIKANVLLSNIIIVFSSIKRNLTRDDKVKFKHII